MHVDKPLSTFVRSYFLCSVVAKCWHALCQRIGLSAASRWKQQWCLSDMTGVDAASSAAFRHMHAEFAGHLVRYCTVPNRRDFVWSKGILTNAATAASVWLTVLRERCGRDEQKCGASSTTYAGRQLLWVGEGAGSLYYCMYMSTFSRLNCVCVSAAASECRTHRLLRYQFRRSHATIGTELELVLRTRAGDTGIEAAANGKWASMNGYSRSCRHEVALWKVKRDLFSSRHPRHPHLTSHPFVGVCFFQPIDVLTASYDRKDRIRVATAATKRREADDLCRWWEGCLSNIAICACRTSKRPRVLKLLIHSF